MVLSSSAFQNSKSIPARYAHKGVTGGQNISFPLVWRDIPPQIKSFSLSLVDHHPLARTWVHWHVINIPANILQLSEGVSRKQMPRGAKELYNSFGEIGYGGPQPPKGSGAHQYELTLYALSIDRLDLSQNSTLSAFEREIEGKILAYANLTGLYER